MLSIMNNVRNEDKGDTTDLMFGVVTSVNPLKIKVDNRYELTSDFLILSALCKQTTIEIPAHHHTLAGSDTTDALTSITLWRGLQIGDKVRMLRVNKGQTFYVIEREEGVV